MYVGSVKGEVEEWKVLWVPSFQAESPQLLPILPNQFPTKVLPGVIRANRIETEFDLEGKEIYIL